MKKLIIALCIVVLIITGVLVMGIGKTGSQKISDGITENVSAEKFEAIVRKNQNAVNDPYYRSGLWKMFYDTNYCPIHYASKCGDAEKIGILIRYGADPNLKDPTMNQPPLWFALKSGEAERFKIARILIDNGADVDAIDRSGGDDIYSISTIIKTNDSPETKKECTEFVKYLIEVTNYTNHQDDYSPIIVKAATHGNNELVEYLLDNNINTINQADSNGMTALMGTAETNKIDTCRLLLERGADKSLRSSIGMTAYDYAKQYGYKEIAELCKDD